MIFSGKIKKVGKPTSAPHPPSLMRGLNTLRADARLRKQFSSVHRVHPARRAFYIIGKFGELSYDIKKAAGITRFRVMSAVLFC